MESGTAMENEIDEMQRESAVTLQKCACRERP